MKVIKRSQITEVITKRVVVHELINNGIRYERSIETKVYIPFMDVDIDVSEPKIKWSEYTGTRTIKYLSAKEVKELKLNELFDGLDINEKNGNA